MKNLSTWVLAVVLLLAAAGLAACGGDSSAATDTGTAGSTEEAQAAPTSSEPTATRRPRPTVPPTPAPGTYSFEASGFTSLAISDTAGGYRAEIQGVNATNDLQGRPLVPETYRIRITGETNTLLIRWPQDYESGEYPIDNSDSGVLVSLTTGDGTRTPFIYDQEVSGTLTLTIANGMVSGEVNYSGSYIALDSSGREVRQDITVTGSFADWQIPQVNSR